MRCSAFEIYRFQLPLARPLRLKGEAHSFREGCLVRVWGKGCEGWGEASPLPGFSAEIVSEVVTDLVRVCEALMRDEPWPFEPQTFIRSLGERMDVLDPLPSVRFAVELAMVDLLTARRGEMLPAVVSPQARDTVRVNALISHESDLEAEADRVRAGGYEAVKLKVGRNPVAVEIGRVRRLQALLGPNVELRIDANRAWDLPTATAFAEGLRGAEVAFVEEPLSEPAHLRAFVEATGLPVALDESVPGIEPATLSEHRYARAVILKPTLCGGLTKTLRMASSAVACGMTPVLSSAFESGIGTLGVAALAASTTIGSAAGLDTYRWLREDVLTPSLEVTSRIALEALWGTPRTVRSAILYSIAGGRP